MSETVVRRIDYRVVRPDGNLIWTRAVAYPSGWVPAARRDGCFAPPGQLDPVAPPFLIQRLDGDDWTTIYRSDVVRVYRFVLPGGKVMRQWTAHDGEEFFPPLVRSDGWAYWGDHRYFAPPWLLQVNDGGEWRTLDQREG